jgi:anti-sigma regulatory factor (Ser/Thr protein kinase)
VRERASLLVSELATNAVRHAQSGFSVSIDETADAIRVEVRDAGGGIPVVGAPRLEEVSGRGLLIVKTMSDSFGIETGKAGKTVWFTLANTPEAGRLQASEASD